MSKKRNMHLEETLIQVKDQPFQIPDNWRWVKLGGLITLISGRDESIKLCNNEGIGIPYIMGASNIRNNDLIIERWIETPTVLGRKGDILISVKGTVGKMVILEQDEVHLSRQIMGIRSNDKTLVKYIYFYIHIYIEKLKQAAKGLIPGISRDDILNAPFPLPPINEQKRIVDKLEHFLSKLDEAKELFEQVKSTSEVRRMAILDKVFRGELHRKSNNTDFNNVDGMNYNIPSDWNWVNVEGVCELIADCPHSTPNYIEDGEYFAIRSSDIRFGKVDVSEAKRVSQDDYLDRTKKNTPQIGDIIYCREGSGAIGKAVGKAGILKDENACLAQRVVLLRPNINKVLPEYLTYVLNSPVMLRQVLLNIAQTTSPRINISTLIKLKIPIAPIELQESIVNFIEKCIEADQEVESNISIQVEKKMEMLKQSIFLKAFRGQLGTNKT